MTSYDELKKAAEAATPGPWEYYEHKRKRLEEAGFLKNPLRDPEPAPQQEGIRTSVEALCSYIATHGTMGARFRDIPLGGKVFCTCCGKSVKKSIQYACHEICEKCWGTVVSAAPLPDEQLCRFYDVNNFPDLVAAMEHHIEKLQAKLPPTPSLAPQRVREG